MKYVTRSKQAGSAALLFILIFPALFAVFVWGVEGARILQSSARLKDATESAALAVSAQQNVTNNECYAITQRFVRAYFPSAQTVQAPAIRQGNEITCVDESAESSTNEFNVTAQVTERSWFPNAQIANYGETFSFSDSVVVRQDLLEPIDVILVANYASTMTDSSGNFSKNKKEKKLQEAVAKIARKLSESNIPNKLALVGFDHFVSDYDIYESYSWHYKKKYLRWRLDHFLRCYDTGWISDLCLKRGGYFYGIFDYYFYWFDFSFYEMFDFYSSGYNFYELYDALNTIDEYSMFNANRIDAEKTLNNIFRNTAHPVRLFDFLYDGKQSHLKKIEISGHQHSEYDVIELTDDFQSITKGVSKFKVASKSNTKSASYTGLIAGARLADQGENSKRLIILLTDGMEESPAVAEKLVDAGLCQRIRQHFTNQSVQLELAIIGFDYDTVSGAAMRRCIGASRQYNYSATDSGVNDDLIDRLLNFSPDGIGRLVQ